MTLRTARVDAVVSGVVVMVVIAVVVLGGVGVAVGEVVVMEVRVWVYESMPDLWYNMLWRWMRLN